MKQYKDFQMLHEFDLVSVNGGKINWGSVAGNCVGGAIVTGAFSGPFYLLGAGIGCAVGSGQAIINGLQIIITCNFIFSFTYTIDNWYCKKRRSTDENFYNFVYPAFYKNNLKLYFSLKIVIFMKYYDEACRGHSVSSF